MAIALSQSEAEESEKRRKKREGSSFYNSAAGKEGNETTKNSTPDQVSGVCNCNIACTSLYNFISSPKHQRVGSSTPS